jgi:hypothetical protein
LRFFFSSPVYDIDSSHIASIIASGSPREKYSTVTPIVKLYRTVCIVRMLRAIALVSVGIAAARAQSCSGDGGSGTCIDKTKQKCVNGELVAGQCPGGNNIECCVTNWGSCPGGTCQMTTKGCSGHYVAGECPGPADVECCSTSPPPPRGVLGVDVDWADHYSISQWGCFVQSGHSWAVIESWNGGLGINSALASDIKNARAAGMKEVCVAFVITSALLHQHTLILLRTYICSWLCVQIRVHLYVFCNCV